jgi:hypothetical protein
MELASLFLLLAPGVLALTGCGGGGGSDSPATGGEERRMTEYSSRAIALRASFSPEAEEKFEALEKKAETCAEKIER